METTSYSMRSTEELNTKIWYRLLKVFYFLALLIVVGITLIICWSDASYTPFNPAQFDATPVGGQLNIHNLPPGSYTPVQPNDVGFVPDPSLGTPPATIPSQSTSFSYRFFSEAIPALVVELLLFELARRLFYYIILGSWRPKKK